MAGSHPKKLDPRPKRRRDKENPYEICTAGINTAHPRYFLAFTDGSNVKRWMEIDKTLFDVCNEFELDDLSFFNEVGRHYEQSEVTKATLNRRAAKPQESVEETVSQRIEVDSCTKQSPNCLKSSAAVWCCTTSESLHMSRLRIWGEVSIPLW